MLVKGTDGCDSAPRDIGLGHSVEAPDDVFGSYRGAVVPVGIVQAKHVILAAILDLPTLGQVTDNLFRLPGVVHQELG